MNTRNTHVDQFIEQLGRLVEGESLPRTAGRMMGLLIVAGTPMGIDEIAVRLKVSRASVSTNSRLLQSLAIAKLVSEPGNRRDYLQISGDPCSSLLALGLQRMRSMRVAMQEMRLAIGGAKFNATRARLHRMEKFYDTAIGQLQAVLGDWGDRQLEAGPVVGLTISSPSRTRASARHARKKRRDARDLHKTT